MTCWNWISAGYISRVIIHRDVWNIGKSLKGRRRRAGRGRRLNRRYRAPMCIKAEKKYEKMWIRNLKKCSMLISTNSCESSYPSSRSGDPVTPTRGWRADQMGINYTQRLCGLFSSNDDGNKWEQCDAYKKIYIFKCIILTSNVANHLNQRIPFLFIKKKITGSAGQDGTAEL